MHLVICFKETEFYKILVVSKPTLNAGVKRLRHSL